MILRNKFIPVIIHCFQARQEMELIPRDPDFHNPYRLENLLQKDETTTTAPTKKPRKRLKRGPRLADGEL